MVFEWFSMVSNSFQMVSNGVPVDFQYVSNGLMVSNGFQTVPNGCPMVLQWFSNGVPMFSNVFQ